jgi:hypothetical protein
MLCLRRDMHALLQYKVHLSHFSGLKQLYYFTCAARAIPVRVTSLGQGQLGTA